MATLTAEQILDMLADLAAGDIGDVFTQDELQRFFDRAGDDYNLAVYYGWRQILANSASWIDYKVAQTSVSRSQAFDHILAMLKLWGDESRTLANQVKIVGMRPVPTKHKPVPADDTHTHGYFKRGRWYPYVS